MPLRPRRHCRQLVVEAAAVARACEDDGRICDEVEQLIFDAVKSAKDIIPDRQIVAETDGAVASSAKTKDPFVKNSGWHDDNV